MAALSTDLSQADAAPKAERCAGRRIVLPVIDIGPDGSPIRPSRSGKWRAVSLMLVHVLILGHVFHWLSAGETVSPIEPSESMETIQTGRINAGFIFFGIAILATMVLGRFVCGWGCHLVAYQDLTNWLLKRLHLRPRAFRSRLLIFVPLAAAIYMFIYPAAYRLLMGIPHPRPTWHVVRSGFWDTFPGYGVAALTVLVCGVAIIYFLGPKGFCTYACPYGAFFGLADKLAIGRIRVTDACNQCGHCTATCTSNVDVAREVRLYRMVVDPGCMKCLDCVSVCPNDALYFGWGRPSLGARPAAPPRARRYDLTLAEEFAAAAVFLGAFLAYRGLYGHIPFLLSLGIAGIVTYLVMKAAALCYQPDVVVQKVRLKIDGRWTRQGQGFAVGVVLLLALTAHSGYWRYHDYRAAQFMAVLPEESFGWQHQPDYLSGLKQEHSSKVEAAMVHLQACERWGFWPCLENSLRMVWLEVLRGNFNDGIARMKREVEKRPRDVDLVLRLAGLETAAGRFDEARATYERAIRIEGKVRGEAFAPRRLQPRAARTWTEWGMFLAARGEIAPAEGALREATEHDPRSTLPWTALGSFEASLGRVDAARRSLVEALQRDPTNHAAASQLERIARLEQDFAAALSDYEAAQAKQPNVPVFPHNKAFALARLGRYDAAVQAYREVLRLNPEAHKARADLGAVLLASGDLSGAVKEYELVVEKLPESAEARLKLAFLYEQTGRLTEAIRSYESAGRNGNETESRAAREALARLRKQ